MSNISYLFGMKLLKYLFLFITFYGYSQYCPYLGPDQILPCGVGSTTLTADLSQCGVGTNPNQTTNYGVTSIPYSPDSYTNGNSVFLGDDAISAGIPIGFNFCYFGQTYSTFYIGSNNWIGFSAGQTTTWVTTQIPNGTGSAPMNCIMGPWQDINPGIGGTVKWAVYGTAPCRRLVISYYQVPMFSCTSQLYSSQIKIYETTNVIETHILNKPICASWNSGNAVHGLHNANGTQSVLVQPPVSTSIRNNNQWSTQNEGVRFTPSGPVVTPVLTWYQVGNPNPIGTGPTITVTPPPQGANYTCRFVYPICNAGWSTCNGSAGPGPDTVFVLPGPPNLPQPTVTFNDPSCYNFCDGNINVTPNGTNGVTTISWNTLQTSFNPNNLCAGNYTFLITDGIGCTVSGNVTLTNPPEIIMNPIIGEDTICYLSNLETYSTLSMGNGFNYFWESSSNITTGQGTETVGTDWSQLPSGFYQDSISVYSTDINGCFSDTSYFSPFILNINPTITPIGPFCSYDGCVDLDGFPLNGVFTGDNVNGEQFCPSITNILNDVTYTYTQSGCIFDTTIVVTVNPEPFITPIVPSDEFFELCEGDSLPKVYSTSSTLSGIYEWTINDNTFNSNPAYYTWNTEGLYVISVFQTANGCISQTEQTTITIDKCPEELIYIPNTFTPDDNEYNNEWGPVFTSGYDPYRFELFIFNRWGEIIWESHNVSATWDGTFGGKKCQDGIYSWIISYGVEDTDERKEIRGYVTIIR